MNISTYLKKIEKTKTELSRELNLSRPTLNQYIDLFEQGRKIENERYDIIFRRLFSDDSMTRKQFDSQMSSVRFLLERDRKYDIGNLKPEAADIVARIHNCIVHDMSDENWNKKIYDSILILLCNYRTNTVMRELAGYFSDLNSDSAVLEVSEETKSYYAYFFKCIKKITNSIPEFDNKEYELFIERRDKIKRDREERRSNAAKKIKSKMNNILLEVELEFSEKGLDASEEEIMTEVIRRIRRESQE